MTKRNNLIVALILLALLVLTAAPAGAKGRPPEPDPLPDGMCTFADAIDIATAPTLTGTLDCVDVFSDKDTAWEFEVVITGKRPWGIKSVYLSVREAHPGDFCWIWSGDPQLLDQDPGQDIKFVVETTDVIPGSTEEGCSEDGGAFDDPTESMVVTLRTTGTKKDATTVVTIRPVTP